MKCLNVAFATVVALSAVACGQGLAPAAEQSGSGNSTIGNVRLRCRAHNLFTAEQAYGEEFMRRKRQRSG